jgi:hypothetical protein
MCRAHTRHIYCLYNRAHNQRHGRQTDKPARVIVRMNRKLVERIDDFRFERRLPSRAAAIRRLIEDGLKANGFGPDGAAEATAKLGRAR